MTRIIAGQAKGRRLAVPSSGTRPTSDRIREAIFARLESWNAVDRARVLDLFAGSGALGIEALSRGAAGAVLVDDSAAATRTIKLNLESVDLASDARVVRQKAATFLSGQDTGGPFELVFIDPPYAVTEEELSHLLVLLVPHLTPDATVVIERDARSPQPNLPVGGPHGGLELLGHRKWGDTAAWFAGPSPVEK